MNSVINSLYRSSYWTKVLITFILISFLGACSSKDSRSSSDHNSQSSVGGELGIESPALTAYEHAQTCAAELGPVPAFDLTSAIEISVQQNGVSIEGRGVQECDLPAAFQAPCERGFLGRLQGTHQDGTINSDVIWTYIVRSGGFAAIGYHLLSGATCFLEIDTLPLNPTILEAPVNVDADTYNAQWTSPREMFEVSRCQDCHMADPFLHSPYIDQVRDPANPDEPLIPIISNSSNPRPPYQIISDPVGPYTTELPNNSCTQCHRPQCTTLFDGLNGYSLDELAMPAPFHNLATWDDATSVADREAVRSWCNTLEPFGPQFSFNEEDTDSGDNNDDVENGPCDIAFDCLSMCNPTDYTCAQECGSIHLMDESASAFATIINCGGMANCEIMDIECLDANCTAELGAFIMTCDEG